MITMVSVLLLLIAYVAHAAKHKARRMREARNQGLEHDFGRTQRNVHGTGERDLSTS